MWHWLAKNPGESKITYLAMYDSGNAPLLNNCHLCEYANLAKKRAGGGILCDYCPLDWGNGLCCTGEALYEKWNFEKYERNPNKQRRTELALRIAELPEKVEK